MPSIHTGVGIWSRSVTYGKDLLIMAIGGWQLYNRIWLLQFTTEAEPKRFPCKTWVLFIQLLPFGWWNSGENRMLSWWTFSPFFVVLPYVLFVKYFWWNHGLLSNAKIKCKPLAVILQSIWGFQHVFDGFRP